MKLFGVLSVSLPLILGAGSVLADEEGSFDTASFAVLNGVQADLLSDSTLGTTYGKHWTMNLPNGTVIRTEGTNGVVFSHVTFWLGGGAAETIGVPPTP